MIAVTEDMEMSTLKEMPQLSTERLVLRGLCRSDASDVFAYASNPKVLQFTTGKTHQSVEDAVRFVEKHIDSPPGEFAWALRLQGQSRVIGMVEFGLGDGTDGSIHYALAEEFWNRGLMTEACRAVLSWAFEAYPTLDQVTTAAIVENKGSTRVMEKCGMTFHEFVEEKWDKFDEPVRLAVYSMPRTDQEAFPKSTSSISSTVPDSNRFQRKSENSKPAYRGDHPRSA
jgi:[ribosomal protein S5]-alanine N-acetyltransferase